MKKKLPYKITTETLKDIEFSFDLSDETKSALAVHQLLDTLLAAINQETKLRTLANGDIIQALTMALAVRVKMMYGNDKVKENIATICFNRALKNAESANEVEQISGTS